MDYLNFENRMTNELTVMFRRAEDPVTKEMARLQALRTREWCRDYWVAMNREVPVRIRFSKEVRMNEHIELVKRYLAGEDVTAEELRANSIAAYASDADIANAVYAAHAAAKAAEAADVAAASTAHWVKKYEERTNE